MRELTDCVLGIDTSNYKTSVAVVDSRGGILCDLRRLLRVKQGERGLRQSAALFQHLNNLPEMLTEALDGGHAGRIGLVAVSDRPRPVEGSYMPVFRTGIGFGQAVAAALQVPCHRFSHQEGHIEAIRAFSRFDRDEPFLCYHLSGGTCELLRVEPKDPMAPDTNGSPDCIERIGGSKDISFGQVIDRVGVKLGMTFPAGGEMDELAVTAASQPSMPAAEHTGRAGQSNNRGRLKRIPADGLFFNLSGIETQCGRLAEAISEKAAGTDGTNRPGKDQAPVPDSMTKAAAPLVQDLFEQLTDILVRISRQARKETGIPRILFTGGVSSSRYISRHLRQRLAGTDIQLEFGDQRFSQDNAVGTALLGGKRLWR